MGVPAPLPGRRGCDRRLPRGVRAAVGGSRAGARHPALDRPLLGEERSTSRCETPRLALAYVGLLDGASETPAGRVVHPARRVVRADQPARRRLRDGPAGVRRRPARGADLALGQDEGHGRRDDGLRAARRSVARRAPAALRPGGHRRRRRPGGGRGARRVHGALAAAAAPSHAAAFTSPASRWRTPTRTRRS